MSTSYFNRASHLAIETVQIQHHDHHHTHSKSRDAFDILQEHVAIGALSNSDERCDAPKCHPETRIAVQQEIVGWAEEGNRGPEARNILWMSGPAGTGKTAIAGSIADTCRERGLLAASFFFSSYAASTNRRSKKFLIPTLAYQLLQHKLAGIKEEILASIEKDPAIFNMRLKDQLQVLILNPLRSMQKNAESETLGALPTLLVIDGLDECEADLLQVEERHNAAHRKKSATDQLEVLSTLLEASRDPCFPFRILVISRPERAIVEFFQGSGDSATTRIFLDEKYEPNADIALFLRSKFSEICRRYKIDLSWPNEAAIQVIVERASGQFVYAATTIRFVEDGSDSPQEQLQRILDLAPPASGETPFADLDTLYSHILLSSPDPRRSASWILCFSSLHVVTATPRTLQRDFKFRTTTYPPVFFRHFFECRQGETEHLLGSLRSLVSIPDTDDKKGSYHVWHKSLSDYLEDPDRCSSAGLSSVPYQEEWCLAYYRCLNARGPPAYQDLDASSRGVFWNRFLRLLPWYFPGSTWIRKELFPAIDKERISQLVNEQLSSPTEDFASRAIVPPTFTHVHVACYSTRGLRCTHECQAWRKACKAGLRAIGEPAPGIASLLREAWIFVRHKKGDPKEELLDKTREVLFHDKNKKRK